MKREGVGGRKERSCSKEGVLEDSLDDFDGKSYDRVRKWSER